MANTYKGLAEIGLAEQAAMGGQEVVLSAQAEGIQ